MLNPVTLTEPGFSTQGTIFRGLRGLLFGSTLYLASTLMINGAKVLLIPVYTRYLTPSEYGVLGVANAVSGFLSMILLLGLDAAVVRQYYDFRRDSRELRSFLSSVWIFMILLNVTTITFLLVFGPQLFAWLIPGKKIDFWPYLALGVLIAGFTNFLGVFMALLQAQKKVVSYVLAQMLRFTILVGLTLTLLIEFRRGAAAPLWGELIATGLVVLVLSWFVLRSQVKNADEASAEVRESCGAKRNGFSFSLPKVGAALAFGVPLVPHELSNWALSVSDRLILTRYRPVEEVGVYVLGYSMAMAMNVLVGAINFAYVPFFLETAQNHPRAQELFGLFARLYVLGVGGICLIAMLFARELLGWIAPPAYSKSAGVLVVVSLAFFFLGLYLVTVLPFFHVKRTVKLPLLSGLAAAVNIGLNLLLVPRYGAMAAAWTTLVAYVVLFVSVSVATRRFYVIDYKWGRFAGLILFVAALGLTLNSKGWEFKLLACAVFLTVATYLSRRDLRSVPLFRAA
jgi:O-antigen/teichoic acid export membrane protein